MSQAKAFLAPMLQNHLKTTKCCRSCRQNAPFGTTIAKMPLAQRDPACSLCVPILAPADASKPCFGQDAFDLVQIPKDGNCLFTAAAVAKVLWDKSKEEPNDAKKRSFGEKNRAMQVESLSKALKENAPFPPPDGPPMRTAMAAASDMSPEDYIEALKSGGLWGGWLEAALMARRWRCQFHVYTMEGQRYVRITSFGPAEKGDEIHLLWTGVHYDVLKRKWLKPASRLEMEFKSCSWKAGCSANRNLHFQILL